MQQPWDEPAEPIEQAAESLPLAGLLAELLAGAEAQGGVESPISGEDQADSPPPAADEAWFERPVAARTEVAVLMRALGEAEQERQEAAAGGLSADLLARLMESPAAEPAPGAAAVASGEPSAAASVESQADGRDLPGAALASQAEPALPAEAGVEHATPSTWEPAALAAPLDIGPAPVEASSAVSGADAGAPPIEPFPATAPDHHLESPSLALLEAPVEEPPEAMDSCASEPVTEAAAPVPAEAFRESSVPGAASGAGAASEAATQAGAGAAPIQSEPGGPWTHRGLPIAALPPEEEDEFELVDAETAGRMLDQLIDAARSAIQSSLAAPPHAQSPAIEARPAVPATASPSGAFAAMESPGSGGALRAERAEEAVQPMRPATGRPSCSAEELGQEPPPLPPAAALIGMGLPERLRARLELIGDLEKVLAAQSDETAARAVDRRSRLLVFRVGDGYYGLPIEHVREVERVTRVTPVPGAPRFVRGLVNLRGEILPLVDMRLLLGAGADDLPASPRLVVAQADRKEPPLALMVEELNGLAPVEEGASGPAAGEACPLPWARGSVEHRGRRVWRLDPAAMLSLAALEERAELR